MLLIRGFIAVFHIFRLPMTHLLIPLWIPELCLLVLFLLYRVLIERFFPYQKCMNSLPGFRKFWKILCLNMVSDTAHIIAYLFNLLPGSVVKSGLHSSPFFTDWRTMLHLVRFAFMDALTGLCFRLSNNIPLTCPSLQPLWEVAKPDLKLFSSFNVQKWPCQILVVGHWQRSLTLKLDIRVIRIARGDLDIIWQFQWI